MKIIGVGTFHVTPKMRQYINNVLNSGRISYGNYSRQLETDFAAMHECKFGVLSNSGTSSLQVAIQALKELRGWQDGDEIIVPAVTFVASVNVVIQNNLTPVLVDIDPLFYELDPQKIGNAITRKTRAIMPVHLFGQPCDMTKISAIAKEHDLAIIEDSCECMAVSHAGKRAGAWGDVACFSTYVAHLLTTGVGGIATTNDERLAVKMRSLVNHGRDGIYISIDDDDDKANGCKREIIARRFKFESIGHSYRITELEAALGLAQLDDLADIIALRQQNAQYLTDKLLPFLGAIQTPFIRSDTEHAFMMFPIVLWHGDKADVTNYLEAHGIETREMLPLTNQPCYRGRFSEADYPIAAWVNANGFYIGCHQGLTQSDLDYIVETFKDYFDDARRNSERTLQPLEFHRNV